MTARLWSTDTVPPAERTDLWRETMRLNWGLSTDFFGDSACTGRLASQQLGQLPISRLTASRHRVVREARAPGLSEPAYLKILAPFEGEAWVHQHQRRALARPGEWVVYDTSEPYVVENPTAVDHLVLMVPRELMQGGPLDMQAFMARTLGAQGVSRVALEAMRAAHGELAHLRPHLAQRTAELMSELIRLSLLQLSGAPSGLDQRAALR